VPDLLSSSERLYLATAIGRRTMARQITEDEDKED